MKTKYLNPKQVLCLIIIVQMFSCESFVEVELPKSQLANKSVFEEFETADAALSDIYASLRTNGIFTGAGSGISNQLGNYSDELISIEKPSNSSLFFYNNALLPANSYVNLYWNSSYNQIYSANSIIEGVSNSTGLSEQQKKLLYAEALFIRSLLHFYMTNLFGDIPYITSTNYKINSKIFRSPSAKIYDDIIRDLEEAADILSVSYSTSDRVRPNKLTIKALLARVYLYRKSYSEAAKAASEVINTDELYSLEPDVNKVFLINSTETIWQLQSGIAGTNTLEGSFFIFTSGPPSLVSLKASLANSFTTGDLRRSNWIKTVSNGTSTWYHTFKYKEKSASSTSKEYSIIFRLAEIYLIRAEARTEEGDFIGAKGDLNKIRNRAGLTNNTATEKTEILEAIQKERKYELFTEFGHRFFDLKRTGRLDIELGSKNGWNSTDNLFPIPESELNTNPNLLPQNPGY
jgi:Starch-binding associating with outer membrane/SusD family